MAKMLNSYKDWGEVSESFDEIKKIVLAKDLLSENEAQTRFDVIDRVIREILQWHYGQITVEEYTSGDKNGYIDYLLRSSDYKIVIEAKKLGASFPSPSKRKKLKLSGSVLSDGEINLAIRQAEEYAEKKQATVVVVTNGICWCFFKYDPEEDRDEIYATVLNPFDDNFDAEQLFKIFSIQNVENGSLLSITNENPFQSTNNLVSNVEDGDARIGRNSIADYISPALDYAFHGESIIGDTDKLKFCFITTDARTKYDSTLKIFLGDKKPSLVLPAKKIKKDKQRDELKENISVLSTNTVNPLTLIIGPVGSGKSTYLSHFELVHAKDLIESKKCFWINIDFEKMGSSGNPRKFIYESLKEFCLRPHKHIKTDFDKLILPAYENEIENLRRGPYALLAKNQEKFNEKIQELIAKDFESVEPYVEKLFSYISSKNLCVIVLDNVDLYENPDLEVEVFSEGIALGKKIKTNIIMSIRDTTYVKHKNDSIFNAYELKKFWLDPPPFREVLARRLKFAGVVLQGKKATIPYMGKHLTIEDLSVFFDIANSALLQESSAKFIESVSDGNIRKGVSLVSNFLTSGHIQADRAFYNYLNKQVVKGLPFHEVFKGASLGQWKHFKEGRAEIINIFNAGFNSRSTQLLRVFILKFLFNRARDKNTFETPIKFLYETFSHIGASENHVNSTLVVLQKNGLIRSTDALDVSNSSIVFITASGAYYYSNLMKRFEYLETILYDTPIFNDKYWDEIVSLTYEIEYYHDIVEKVERRISRMKIFINYLKEIESSALSSNAIQFISVMQEIEPILFRQMEFIENNAKKYYGTGFRR